MYVLDNKCVVLLHLSCFNIVYCYHLIDVCILPKMKVAVQGRIQDFWKGGFICISVCGVHLTDFI